MIDRLLGFETPGVVSALLFPFAAPDGGLMNHVRMKIFPPRTDAAGHQVKYLQPRGSCPRLYFVRQCLRAVCEGDAPLYVSEGEKKSASLAQLGVAVIGISGVRGWHRKGTRTLLEDFGAIRLRGRLVKILPDGDVRSNYHVECAVQELGA